MLSEAVAPGLRAHQVDPWRPRYLAEAGLVRWAGANLVVGALYCALGYVVSLFFARYGLFPAPIWLPCSLAVVAGMLGGWRFLPGIFLGSFAVNYLLFNPPFLIATIISATNAVGPVLGATLTRWARPRNGLFTRFSGVIAFMVCNVLLHPAITASGGTFAVALQSPQNAATLYSTWVSWWLSDSGGTLYLAPALLLWLKVEGLPGRKQASFDRRDLAVWLGVAVVALFLFATPPFHGSNIGIAFPFLLVVPVSWIALKMSLRAAFTLIFLVSIVACAATVVGHGPFEGPSMTNPLQFVSALVVLLAMNVLTIVALVCERRDAQESNKVKSMFLANMSHELRTPLNAIIGFSDLMEKEVYGPIENERYAEFAGHILSSGRHLLSLINDVLDMSKIEAGRMELQEERIVVGEMIEAALSLVKFQATTKSISLSADVAAPDIVVKVDRKAFRQILLNLLSNGIKFTPEGGRVWVEAKLSNRGELVLRVGDTGIGIPKEALVRVFIPFEQVNASLSRTTEGTGLGLSITRGLVTLHGGSISLQSKVGGGTVVTVILPASRVVPLAESA